MSNIEEDIKRCEQLIKPEHANWIGISNQLAIAHVVDRVKEVENDLITVYLKGYADAEEKYKSRIKKLEAKLEFKKWGDLDNIQFDEYMSQFIPKPKVKDILQKNRNELFSITYLEPKQYEPYEKQIERINKIETELLEGE